MDNIYVVAVVDGETYSVLASFERPGYAEQYIEVHQLKDAHVWCVPFFYSRAIYPWQRKGFKPSPPTSVRGGE